MRDLDKSLITESEYAECGKPVPPLLLSAKHVDKLKKVLPPAYQSSLSLYPATGSRVYSIHEEQWGIIERKYRKKNGTFQYSVGHEWTIRHTCRQALYHKFSSSSLHSLKQVRLENGSALLHGLGDAEILPEVGYKRKTGRESPHPPKVMEHGNDKDSKYGSSEDFGTEIATTLENFLVGRKVRFAWLDIGGRMKEVRGRVEACEVSTETADATKCLVVYQEISQSLANSMTSETNSLVPKHQWLDRDLVVGGCIRYEERASKPITDRLSDRPNLRSNMDWVIPHLWSPQIENGLPTLKLGCGDFLLEFRIQESSIKGAGKGVFVTCTSLEDDGSDDDEQQDFRLDEGKGLDIGIYAPFRPKDKKSDAVCLVKNYIHSSKCEDWLMDANEPNSQFDITDDGTGYLHSAAKRSILPFVNESDDDQQICIHAVHDPENAVHYLLGNLQDTNRAFTLPCDGTAREVFVNYGQGYEKVRIRNGYSFLPKPEQSDLEKELENEHVTDLQVIGAFCSAEVAEVTTFMSEAEVEDPSKLTDEMIQRATTCAVVLLRRTKRLIDKEDEEESVDLQSVFKTLNSLVEELLKMTKGNTSKLQGLQARGKLEGLWKAVLKRQEFTSKELEELEQSMG